MSDLDGARARFVAAFEGRAERAAGDIFDEGLRMARDGAAAEDIKAFLAGATQGGEVGTRGDAAQCASECRDQCKDYPDGPPWYACYAGCFAGCMSA